MFESQNFPNITNLKVNEINDLRNVLKTLMFENQKFSEHYKNPLTTQNNIIKISLADFG